MRTHPPPGLYPAIRPDSGERDGLLTGRLRFRPHERVLSSAAYERVKREGNRRRTTHFAVNTAPNGLSCHRLGLIVQKRFWNAVLRNRIKRCLREWFRLNKERIPLPGKDVVVIARPGAEELSPGMIGSELMAVFVKGKCLGS